MSIQEDVAVWSTTRQAAAIRSGEFTSRELLELMIDRISRINGELNAVITLDLDSAREAADHADRMHAEGKSLGALHGVPITVKDALETTGIRSTGGAIELAITFTAPLPEDFGLTLLADDNGDEGLTISAGANKTTFSLGNIEPPLKLEDGENLSLRIFIDKNLVEVFANDRQAASFIHEHIRKNPNISLFTKDTDVRISKIMAWKMKSIYEGSTVFGSN